ncbi:hypothetical protein [Streptomyces sp. NPDC002758]
MWWSDGGGKVSAARRPVEGRAAVARFLAGGTRKFAAGLDYTVAEVNGAAALLAWAGDTVVGVVCFELRDGLITRMHAVANPDRLEFVRRQLARS